ncbi:hypothetical protein NOMA109596_19110 [Nocardioides marinus]|uniref:Fumarate reductase subunit D n=1 Tax=Nocardioides marinus TaxID=374514 RepID=A0A7Y9YBP5_9ACTN|nr:hypothetical protein [Nocardioides marinus]NYI08924.1 fumarate reductase subunit D [Nocardioides marinus]
MDRPKVVAAIVIGLIVLVLGAMVVIGLIQGDDVDREENPVIGLDAVALTR